MLGRAFVARACFRIAGVPFEDETITFDEFKARRGEQGYSDTIPSGSLPVLTLPSGKVICQSGAILRYAAKLAKLYPTDNDEEALLIDEIVETCADIASSAPQHADPEVKKS